MALSALIVWEIRTTGNANNGGGFKSGATGTDYSQQDSAQYSPSSALSTSGSSATIAYTAASTDMVGNLINITGGTNFTTGRYEIISVSAGVSITVDRNCTSGAGSGGSGNIGGAVTLASAITAAVVQGNKVWIKNSGSSHVLSATCSWSGLSGNGNTAFVDVEGYGSSRGDSTHPTITSSTNSTHLFTLNAGSHGIHFKHITFTHTATTRGNALSPSGTIVSLVVEDCIFDGLASAIDSSGTVGLFMVSCEVKNCTGSGVTRNGSDTVEMYRCWIHNNGSHGLILGGNNEKKLFLRHCIFSNNAADGFHTDHAGATDYATIDSCVFFGNGSDGIDEADTSTTKRFAIINCIFYGNTGYGIKWNGTVPPGFAYSFTNAFGGNGTAAYSSLWPSSATEVTLSANPFTDSAHDDYTLNATAGGGAACKGAGSPQSIP